MKVLIVEDDILLGKQYARLLSSRGIRPIVVTHAIDAMQQIDEVQPDAIVLDMLLVGSTAVTLLHEIQSHEDIASIPIVLVTSIAETLTPAHMKPYGVVKILDKTTMRPEDLITAVRGVLL